LRSVGFGALNLPNKESTACELMIIGAGMAGMASALFAANRGLSTALIGRTGETVFASGLLDLLGIHPVEEKKWWLDPWAGIDKLCQDIPNHPYARLRRDDIRHAFEEVLSFLNEAGCHYVGRKARNCDVLTPIGTRKRTYRVTKSMWPGVEALEEKHPCLLVDFEGLREFNAGQIVSTLKTEWPDLRTIRILFPGMDHISELHTGLMAQAMEVRENREKLAQAIRPHVENAHSVGMPAILGMYSTNKILAELEDQIGVPVFEIPTLPPSVPGLRLKETFESQLSSRGIKLFLQKQVVEVAPSAGSGFDLKTGNEESEHHVRAKGVVLASGRFLGGGLVAERKGIRETVFNLPVHQPRDRKNWHRLDPLDSRGHAVNRAGLEIDDQFRPVDNSGHPAFRNLFAAGSILAHQDWMRMKCGSGLAIATAYGAVNGFLKLNR
jgi:glycerol-3-phosphate dehydrogenase subunit B